MTGAAKDNVTKLLVETKWRFQRRERAAQHNLAPAKLHNSCTSAEPHESDR